MFIEIKDYLIPEREILYIQRVGWGLRVVTKGGTVDMIDVSDEEYDRIKWRLCGTTWKPEDALCNLADKVAKEDEETRRLLAESKEVMSMKLCNRKSCEGCEHIQTIENPIDNTEPHIFICKKMRKEVLDNNTSLPTPYDFYKSEYHYEEEK